MCDRKPHQGGDTKQKHRALAKCTLTSTKPATLLVCRQGLSQQCAKPCHPHLCGPGHQTLRRAVPGGPARPRPLAAPGIPLCAGPTAAACCPAHKPEGCLLWHLVTACNAVPAIPRCILYTFGTQRRPGPPSQQHSPTALPGTPPALHTPWSSSMILTAVSTTHNEALPLGVSGRMHVNNMRQHDAHAQAPLEMLTLCSLASSQQHASAQRRECRCLHIATTLSCRPVCGARLCG